MAKDITLDQAVEEQLKLAKQQKPSKRKRRTKDRAVTASLDAVIIPEDAKQWFGSVAAEFDKQRVELEKRKDSRKKRMGGVDRENRARRQASERIYGPYRKRLHEYEATMKTAAAFEKVTGEMSADGIELGRKSLRKHLLGE